MTKINLTYKDLHNYTDILINKITNLKFKPDIIISVAMWWIFLWYLLTKWLKIKKFESIQIQSYKWEKQESIKDLSSFNLNIKDKKILLVDDLVDSWNTIKYILDKYFQSVKEIKIATWIYKKHSIIKPDFYAKTFDKERIIFPYEIYE